MWKKLMNVLSGNGKKLSALHGKSVLVVDDGELERRTTRRILEKYGCSVSCAEDGERGYDLATRGRFDLILLDCVMPGLTGPQVCKKLKEQDVTKNIPVIFLTGSDTPTNIINCYDLGAEQFLAKPVSAKLLIKQIEAILNEHV